MSKQTAVEWLQAEIDNKDMGEIPMWVYEFIEQAKAMEKEEISIAYLSDRIPCSDEDAEQYYNETYGGDTKQ
jgi:hypothetical protein